MRARRPGGSRNPRARMIGVATLGASLGTPLGCGLLYDQDHHLLYVAADDAGPLSSGDEPMPDSAGDAPAAAEATTVPDGPGVADAGLDAQADVRTQAESGASAEAGPGQSIRCEQQRCMAAGSACCFSNVIGGVDGAACTLAVDCPPSSVLVLCTSNTDCLAQGQPPYCCATLNQSDYQLEGAVCQSTCPRGSNNGVTQLLCDPANKASTDQCQAVDASGCSILNALLGLYACQ